LAELAKESWLDLAAVVKILPAEEVMVLLGDDLALCCPRVLLSASSTVSNFFTFGGHCHFFYIYFCFLLGCRYKYKEQTLGCLGFALWMVLKKTESLSVERR
jgi:hypothetical protein